MASLPGDAGVMAGVMADEMNGVVAAVLCGGASRRMGADKATLVVDGQPMAARVASAALSSGCRSVFAVGGEPAAIAAIGLHHVADLYPGEGPLGGVITALAHAVDSESVLVVACDLLSIEPDTLTAVVHALGDHDVAMAHSGRSEPMCAVWRAALLPQLRAAFAQGVRSVVEVLDSLDAVMVMVPVESLRNVNTPDDLEQGR